MSDKQRADHVQAKYWNGFITRTEAQKVFDDLANVIKSQAVTLHKMDAVVSCLAEKTGVSPEDVNAWVQTQIEKAQANAPTNNNPISDNVQGQPADNEPPRIIAA